MPQRNFNAKTMRTLFLYICLLFAFRLGYGAAPWTHILHKIEQHPNLKRFHELIERNRIAKPALIYRELTIFAPTDEAFAAYEGAIDEELALFHIVPVARTLDNLNNATSLSPLLEQHPHLWINTKNDDLYVNNARIIRNYSDFTTKTRSDSYGKLQVLHVIDEVLSPVCLTKSSPSAYDVLAQPKRCNFHTYTFNAIYRRIYAFRMTPLFKSYVRGTFFVTPDQYLSRAMETHIDRDVLDANIINDRVIFTRTALDNHSYVTRCVDKDFYVTVEFIESDVIRVSKMAKASNKRVNEQLAKIVHANIPVKNGVVHIVRHLIGVFEHKLRKFPFLPVISKLQGDLQLNITDYLFEQCGLSEMLYETHINYTLFLPTDTAWRHLANKYNYSVDVFNTKQFIQHAAHIMRRHIVCDDYYDVQRLLTLSNHVKNGEIRLDVGIDMLHVKIDKKQDDVHILWGVQRIKIIRPDYECTNGVIHLIDMPFIHPSEMRALGADHNSFVYKASQFFKQFAMKFH